jgi:hypothetical protein
MFVELRAGLGVRECSLSGLFFDADMVGARFYAVNHFGFPFRVASFPVNSP